jgi:DNA/RNA endonuclease G (NUC1)
MIQLGMMFLIICNRHLYQGIPPMSPSSSKYLCQNDNFAVSYDTTMLNPAWTSIYIKYTDAVKDKGGRKNFVRDPNLDEQASVSSSAFKDPLNHGHLVPSYIVSFDKDVDGPWYCCYYMSNISPQYGKFNQQCWANLENRTRNFILTNEVNMYIITGVAYKNRDLVKRIDNVAVPDYFFKVLITDDGNCVGFYGNNVDEVSYDCLVKHLISDIELLYKGKIADCKYDPTYWKNF